MEIEAQLAALQSLSQVRDILKQTIWKFDELLKKNEKLDHPFRDSHLWEGARYVLWQSGNACFKGLGGKIPSESLRTSCCASLTPSSGPRERSSD